MLKSLLPLVRTSITSSIVIASTLTASACWADDASAPKKIDGVWSGTYTSTSSPNPTNEILMFETLANGNIAGVYLSMSGAAGTGNGKDSQSIAISQPVAGCPEPAKGVLKVDVVSADKINYTFSATSCKGPDNGKGHAVRYNINKKPAHTTGPTPAQSLQGFWNGVYTSMDSPKSTHEILAFNTVGTTVTGVYLSKSGATGILTGSVTGTTFTLNDAASPTGTFVGILKSPTLGLSYGFYTTTNTNPDIGNGVGSPAAKLPW